MKKCIHHKEQDLCALRSWRMENVSPLAIKTINRGLTHTQRIDPHFQCKGDLYFYVRCEGEASCKEAALPFKKQLGDGTTVELKGGQQ